MTEKPSIFKIYYDLLFKELEIINSTIKNLDDIIFKTKNFAFLIWGGSLYFISEKLKVNDVSSKSHLFIMTALIPLLFWVMDYRWRKHILQCSKREKIISLFINSAEFKKIVSGEYELPPGEQFPFFDPVGWIYTMQSILKDKEMPNDYFGNKYLIDEREFTFRKIILYKDAYIFYGTLISLSFLIGITISK